MDELLSEFLNEGYKVLDLMGRDLDALSRDPSEKEPAARLCRGLHTIKGTSGMLGFSRVQKVAQAAEDLLRQVKEEKRSFHPSHADVLRRLSEALEDAFARLQDEGTDEALEFGPLVEELEGLLAEA
jgi:two-component system chemotaxis sensor kinase CheA